MQTLPGPVLRCGVCLNTNPPGVHSCSACGSTALHEDPPLAVRPRLFFPLRGTIVSRGRPADGQRGHLASLGRRILAQLLDAVFATAPLNAGFLFVILTESAWLILTISAVVACIAYLFLADALPGGQSYGKRIVGIAVVNMRTGRPCRLWQALIRNLSLVLLGLIDWLFIFGPERQRLGDILAGTIVVTVRDGGS